jgi:hypothetical protein
VEKVMLAVCWTPVLADDARALVWCRALGQKYADVRDQHCWRSSPPAACATPRSSC